MCVNCTVSKNRLQQSRDATESKRVQILDWSASETSLILVLAAFCARIIVLQDPTVHLYTSPPRFKVSVQHETRDSHNNSAWQCITERVESEDQPCTEPRKGHKAGVFAIFRVFGVCLGPLMSLGLPYKYNVQVIVCRCGSLSFDMFAPEINRIIHAK